MSKELSIKVQSKEKTLSKEANRFNVLLARLEKSEQKRDAVREKLDANLKECLTEVQPVYTQWCEVKLSYIEAFLDYDASHKIAKKNRENLLNYFREMANEIIFGPHGFSPEKYEELQAALRQLDTAAGVGNNDFLGFPEEEEEEDFFNDDVSSDFERIMDSFQEHLDDVNLDIDISDFHEGMTEEEMVEIFNDRIAEAIGDTSRKRKKNKKKSKAQIKKEEAAKAFAESKDKSFTAIYKSLVKLLHPDSEQDERLREQKTDWMKRLTVAFKNKDLKSMLLIELEWMKKSGVEAEKWSEEKLSHFNEMLNEQIQKVQIEEAQLYQHERYSRLSFFANGPFQMTLFKSKPCLAKMKTEMAQDLAELNEFKSSPQAAKKVIKSICDEIKRAENDMEVDELLQILSRMQG